MIINHNVTALNTHNKLSAASAAQSKSMEKLASGLRINKAGDDAAGLAISEKMRAQVRGLDQASRNAQDGISLIQTAEGALNETHDILQRMRELAVQSSNDTNTDSDRVELQKEVDQLAEEVTRISNNTEFNTQTLMNGGVTSGGKGSLTFHIGANKAQNISLDINAMDAKSLGVSRDSMGAGVNSGATNVLSSSLSVSQVGTKITDGASLTLSANDTAKTGTWGADAAGLAGLTLTTSAETSKYNDFKITTVAGANGADVVATVDYNNKTITLTGGMAGAAADAAKWSAVNVNSALTNAGITDITASGTTTAYAATANASMSEANKGLGADEVKLHLSGGGSDEYQIVKENATSVKFTSASFEGLSLKLDGNLSASTAATIAIRENRASAASFSNGQKTNDAVATAGIDISSQTSASNAIETIQSAIENVSAERSKLGAVQNRLDHTINNLKTSSENVTAAESRIRDVDMAKEMMNQTKNSILAQAAQAMLAQSNQTPQGVLQLLR